MVTVVPASTMLEVDFSSKNRSTILHCFSKCRIIHCLEALVNNSVVPGFAGFPVVCWNSVCISKLFTGEISWSRLEYFSVRSFFLRIMVTIVVATLHFLFIIRAYSHCRVTLSTNSCVAAPIRERVWNIPNEKLSHLSGCQKTKGFRLISPTAGTTSFSILLLSLIHI